MTRRTQTVAVLHRRVHDVNWWSLLLLLPPGGSLLASEESCDSRGRLLPVELGVGTTNDSNRHSFFSWFRFDLHARLKAAYLCYVHELNSVATSCDTGSSSMSVHYKSASGLYQNTASVHSVRYITARSTLYLYVCWCHGLRLSDLNKETTFYITDSGCSCCLCLTFWTYRVTSPIDF